MIIGAHTILYSRSADSDRAFLRDVLKFPSVDVGGGWLIFGLPPSEVAVHPSESDSHELYLMVDDVEGFVAEMQERGIACEPVTDQRWGLLTSITLPGGGKLGVYEPLHARPVPAMASKPRKARAGKKSAKKPAKKAKAPAKAKVKKTAAKKSRAR